MNRITRLLAAGLLLAAASAAATPVALRSGSTLWLEGTSTLHPYRSDAEKIDVSGDLQGETPARMTVKIPVAELKSEHKGLDKNLQKALKAGENPDIVFTLENFTQIPGSDEVEATGKLEVAGVAKQETIRAKVAWRDGEAVVDGQEPLLMTDFGVKPPKMMMGAIKTDNQVLVKFHLVLGPQKETAPKGGK